MFLLYIGTGTHEDTITTTTLTLIVTLTLLICDHIVWDIYHIHMFTDPLFFVVLEFGTEIILHMAGLVCIKDIFKEVPTKHQGN